MLLCYQAVSDESNFEIFEASGTGRGDEVSARRLAEVKEKKNRSPHLTRDRFAVLEVSADYSSPEVKENNAKVA